MSPLEITLYVLISICVLAYIGRTIYTTFFKKDTKGKEDKADDKNENK